MEQQIIDAMESTNLRYVTAGRIYDLTRYPAGRKALFKKMEKMSKQGKIRKDVDYRGFVYFRLN